MRRKAKSFIKGAVVLLAAGMLGCGGGGDEHPVPPNSQVQMNPINIEWNLPASPTPRLCDELGRFQDHLISISVKDRDGRPLGKVRLTLVMDHAGNTSSTRTIGLLRLYDDKNGNRVIDDPAELVSAAGAAMFVTETEEFTGVKTVWVRVNTTCGYKGSLNAYAGDAHAALNISVVELKE